MWQIPDCNQKKETAWRLCGDKALQKCWPSWKRWSPAWALSGVAQWEIACDQLLAGGRSTAWQNWVSRKVLVFAASGLPYKQKGAFSFFQEQCSSSLPACSSWLHGLMAQQIDNVCSVCGGGTEISVVTLVTCSRVWEASANTDSPLPLKNKWEVSLNILFDVAFAWLSFSFSEMEHNYCYKFWFWLAHVSNKFLQMVFFSFAYLFPVVSPKCYLSGSHKANINNPPGFNPQPNFCGLLSSGLLHSGFPLLPINNLF